MPSDNQRLLEKVIPFVVPAAAGVEARTSAWGDQTLRRSEQAAITLGSGNMTIGQAGIANFEAAVEALLRTESVRRQWDAVEVWSIIASLAVACSFADDKKAAVAASLRRFRDGGRSLVVIPISNVTWSGASERLPKASSDH